MVHHCSNVVYHCFSADDHTRVTLAEVEGFPGSDYINANFIDVSMEFFCKKKPRIQTNSLYFTLLYCFRILHLGF